jgi:DNA polymerase III epsilon subunit-like protein
MEFKHCMVDLETLSTDTSAVIVTIAAVKFNFENDEIETFTVNVDPKSSLKYGMTISQDTLDWWKRQDKAAVDAWKQNAILIEDALDQFNEFIGDASKTVMWAQGIDFDFPVLRYSLRNTEREIKWKYWNQCDSRTIFTIANFNTKKGERVGQYHNAIDDCRTQIAWLKQILSKT